MSRYRVRGMGREFVVIADSETNAVKKLKDCRALKDDNVIPRNAKRLKLTAKTVSSAGKPGDVVIVEKDEYGDWVGTQNGRRYQYLVSNIRNPNYYDVEVLDSAIRDDSKYDKIKDWYIKAYPSDSLGKEIDPRATFYGAWTTIFNYKTDIYDYIGVDDSVVRERIFKELSKRFGMTYDKIYTAWLSDSAIEDGLTSAEKHNRAMEKIFSNYDNQNNKMAEYLARHGVSSAEIEKLRQNTGLHGNALAEKIQKIGKWDDFWKNRDSAIEEEMDIEDLDETIYGSGEYIEEKLKDSDYIDYNGGTIRIGTGFEGMSGVPKGMDIKCEFYKKHNTFYDLIKWYPVGTSVDSAINDFKRYINNHIKDSKALKDAVHTTNIDYVSADAAKKALEVLKRAGYDAMLKTPTKVIVNTDKDISDFIFDKTDGVFICSNEG